MGGEAFDAGEFFDDWERGLDGFFVESHDAGAALELVGAQAGEGSACTTGGEGVAGSREEVANGNG